MFDTSVLKSPPLTGRADELGQIAALRGLASTCGVVIEGPAGVGKSRLAREALRVAEDGGAFVEWAHASRSAASVPMGAVVNLLDGVDEDTPLGILRACNRALHDRAGDRRIVLGVDDAQLLDPQSASLIFHLASVSAAFIVVTVRTPEPCPDAVVALWKDLGAVRLRLDTLDERQTGELVESSLGGPVAQAVHRWAFERSRGNVLYLRELLLGAAVEGAFAEEAGLWRLSQRPRPSRSLLELVTERMAGLDDSQRGILDLLALGEPLLVSEAIELAGAGPLSAAEENGIVTVRGRQVSLAHPLYGEVVAAQMPASRAQAVRLALARTVQAREPRTSDDALRIARWLLDAGELVPAETLLQAARAAISGGDPDFGAELAERALGTGNDGQVSLVLSRAHFVRERYEEAESVLAAAEEALSSQSEALAHLEQRSITLFWGLKRPDDAVALLERAEGWWPDSNWRLGLSPLKIHLISNIKGWQATANASERVLTEPALDPKTRHRLEALHAANLFHAGRAREAAELAARIRPTVPLQDQDETIAFACAAVIDTEVGVDWPGLEAWLAQIVVDAIRADDHEAAGMAAYAKGFLSYMQARYREAARWLGEAELHDAFWAQPAAIAVGIGVAVETDNADAAAAALDRFHEAITGREMLPTLPVWVARAEGWAARAAGNASRARAVFMEAAEQMAVPSHSAALYHEALRFGEPAKNIVGALERELVKTDAPLVAAFTQRARALIDRDGSGLLACADAFEAIGATRFASESAAQAAEAFVHAGRQDSARRAAARSRDLYEYSGEGGVPTIEGVDGVIVGLTAREAEIVELAARGLSNMEIAERLVLSIRTIESHMYRAMAKLGISDRRDLARQPRARSAHPRV